MNAKSNLFQGQAQSYIRGAWDKSKIWSPTYHVYKCLKIRAETNEPVSSLDVYVYNDLEDWFEFRIFQLHTRIWWFRESLDQCPSFPP